MVPDQGRPKVVVVWGEECTRARAPTADQLRPPMTIMTGDDVRSQLELPLQVQS